MIRWKPVLDYEGLYSVSNTGLVRSETRRVVSKRGIPRVLRGRNLVLRKNRSGYYIVFLSSKGIVRPYQVHRLVCSAFLKNTNNLPCVNHKNGIRCDNRVENLEWCSYSENNRHAFRVLGRINPMQGRYEDKNPRAKPVLQVLEDGNIREYSCAVRAAKENNMSAHNITAVCRGEQHTAGGFVWKWK